MKVLNSVNREDLGLVITQEQLACIPGLREVCSDLINDHALSEGANSNSPCLEDVWDVVWHWKGGGIQSQVAGYAPGSLDELLCLRDGNYDPVLIAARQVICNVVNRVSTLCHTPIANGCYCINVEEGISFLAYREEDEVSIMDEAYFGCEQFITLDDENQGRTVTIEKPATGKRYAGTMTDVWESPHEILFIETDDEQYVSFGDGASVMSFSSWAWEGFCEGYNPRT
jgi:hypothetical protein